MQVDRRGPGFTRLGVTVADGRSVVVEIAHDARSRESVQLSFGRLLHPDEVPDASRDRPSLSPLSPPDASSHAPIGPSIFLASYFRLSRPDTSWCITWSQAGEGSRERLRNLRSVMRTLRPSQWGQGQVRLTSVE